MAYYMLYVIHKYSLIEKKNYDFVEVVLMGWM